MQATTPAYGQLPLTRVLGIIAVLLPLPAVLIWTALTKSHASYNKHRSVKRIVGDSIIRYSTHYLELPQLQYLLGTTLGVYRTWTRKAQLLPVIDELGEDARLLWIGPKRLDRVILFLHGGGFVLPVADYYLSFWQYVQSELAKRDIKVGVAVLQYSLAPMANFPTPLNQARLALEFLIAAGVKPANLQLTGDSAGGNLVVQLLSQMLHPRPGIPEIHLPSPLRSAFLMSPWVVLTTDSQSYTNQNGIDLFTKECLSATGDIGRQRRGSKRVDGLVERVLVTAGGAECMYDDITEFVGVFTKHHRDVEFAVQPGGLHEDPLLDFLIGEKKLGVLTPRIVDWIAAGFA
ncbi:Abhydrolase-3 domain-containing protein [Mycena venus]|uniref:Abhydrolase-3 domain-containing protein n=1 Tax=Mycena venus TaxID=2733690 RepID=A0A8H6YQW1_9AGAR|nr:Abhydrolase-3 domain-containing protein [Mycena venus]